VHEVLTVIPARYASSRFPGKALADLGGRPLIVRVAEMAARMRNAGRVIIATDDRRIRDAVLAAGHACELTGEHATGSDRVGEVAARHASEFVLNLQGDEPLLDPAAADRVIDAVRRDPRADIATCAHPLADRRQWQDPNVVKVLVDRDGFALYFSRAPVPGVFPGSAVRAEQLALRHVGIYAYRASALTRFLELEHGALERAERLEQLRALEHGLRIKVVPIDTAPLGVDTPADLEEVRRCWREIHDE